MNDATTTTKTMACSLVPGDCIAGYAGKCEMVERLRSVTGGYIIWFRLEDPSYDGGARYISRMFEEMEPVEVVS
jgi:hypothetical protein